MADNFLNLSKGESAPLVQAPHPEEVRLETAGFSHLVDKGEIIPRGHKLAACKDIDGGDLHAPFAAKVTEEGCDFLRLAATDSEECVETLDISPFEGSTLREVVKLMGMDVHRLVPAQTLVINGVNPEPMVDTHLLLALERHKTLKKGLSLAEKVIRPAETLFTVQRGTRPDLLGNGFAWVDSLYPLGLDPLAVKAATGTETLEGERGRIVCLSTHYLYRLGRIAETGLPLAETVLTVHGRTMGVTLGTMAGSVFEQAGLVPGDRDRIVFGGPMRGTAAISPDRGVSRDDYGLMLLREDEYPAVSNRPCMGCGECVRVCPSRIRPDMIAGLAEAGLFDRTPQYHVHSCMECGMCAYVCTAVRPLLQYIVLAKQELARMEACSTV